MKKRKELDNLPIFYINIDDDDQQGIDLVSLVVDPAIEMKGMYFSKQDLTSHFRFTADEEHQKIVGPAMIPNKKILRKDDDTGQMYYVVFTEETILKMVKKFNRNNNNRSINVDHSDTMVNGYIEQNWIVGNPNRDKSKDYGYNCPKGTWFIEVVIEDKDFWDKEVKEMGKYSFSIEGLMGMSPYKMSLGNIDKFEQLIESLTYEELWSLTRPDVSFDFDGTLSEESVQLIAIQRIKQGDNVYIVTKRSPSEEVYSLATKLGIKKNNIVFTSGEPKWSFLKRLGIDEHYDDVQEEIDEIHSKTLTKVYKV